jgi:hypothetical protein
MAFCCQNLTLGALSSRSALSLLVGALFKNFGFFLNTPCIFFSFWSLVVIVCTNRFSIQKIYILTKEGIYTVCCMLLTTESDLFTVCIYSTGITTETVCVFTVQYELKLYIVFRLIFVCKGLISCVYYMKLFFSVKGRGKVVPLEAYLA